MTLTLLIIAGLAAFNPMRAAAMAPPRLRRDDLVVPAAGFGLAGVAASAMASGPFLSAIDVTGASARIAAGVAIVAVALRELVVRAPSFEPAPKGRSAALFPLTVPALLTPAVVVLAMAGADDRGWAVATLTLLPGLALACLMLWRPPLSTTFVVARMAAGLAVAIGAFVTLDGVYAI